ncbi:Phosphomannomutase [Dictyocoela muelleri]|nr:Phosphomannomutase [Dictyocoela muelleri]
MSRSEETIFLFDVDGTLTPSRQKAIPEILEMLNEARKHVYIGFVGGSDLEKQKEQVGSNILDIFDYSFPENGVSAYFKNQLIHKERIIDKLGEDVYQKLINFSLKYLSKIELPLKRGLFIELRDSMLNISPIGRSCTQEERQSFVEYDKKHQIRENMVKQLRENFGKYNIHFSIGGQISIDCFPIGWDKTYCLRHLEKFKNIYFFGDMVMRGGNDYEIFESPRTIGVQVSGPSDTIKKVNEILKTIKR